MSHHFDTPSALEDPRINVCDLYLFDGRPGRTVMAMTVNPDAGISAPDTFREEGLYAIRFDLNGDAREELAFKIMFGPPEHVAGDEHRHVQTFELRKSVGRNAVAGFSGELLHAGHTGGVTEAGSGIRVFAGLAPDLFAGDAAAFNKFRDALFKEHRLDVAFFQSRQNFFAKRNVTAIVIEVPTTIIGRGLVRAWATASLFGHAPEMQVSRWGLPLLTHLFIPDLAMRELFNRSVPSGDRKRFGPQIAQVAETCATLGHSSASPREYGQQVLDRLCPVMLPYHLGTPAAFDFTGFNGRALTDDVMDVILTLATNTALGDGAIPDADRTRGDFPYFGAPYTASEQAGVKPAVPPSARKG
jgi:hypothetical protein